MTQSLFVRRQFRTAQTEGELESGWLERAIKGDKEAFACLYTRHYGQIYAFCMRMLQGRSEVEDAAQQVFLEAWRSLYRFERRSLFSTWLTKIAIHTCLSFHRKTGRITSFGDDEDPWEHVTEYMWCEKPSAPDEQSWKAERKRAVDKILNRMTRKKQIVFVLSDMQGMSAPEISSILGIPDATVRTRLFHARKEFLSCVNKNPIYRDLLASQRV